MAKRTLKRNTLLGTVNLPIDYTVSFDITPNGRAGGWRNIIHVTATGGNCCSYGDRAPAIWFYSNTRRFHMIDGHAKVGNDECPIRQQLADKKTTHVQIEMQRSFVNVYWNGKKMCREKRSDRKNWPKAKVYASDPWYNPALATIANFAIVYSPPLKGAVVFQKKGTFKCKKSTLIGNVNLPTDYSVDVDITPSGVAGGWRSILHFTTGGNCCGYGSRIPGVWFYSNTRRLLVVDGHTKNGNDYCTGGAMDKQIANNKKTHLKVILRQDVVDIFVNGKAVSLFSKVRHCMRYKM